MDVLPDAMSNIPPELTRRELLESVGVGVLVGLGFDRMMGEKPDVLIDQRTTENRAAICVLLGALSMIVIAQFTKALEYLDQRRDEQEQQLPSGMK